LNSLGTTLLSSVVAKPHFMMANAGIERARANATQAARNSAT